MKLIISIDAMGGDHGPSVTVPAALNLLKKYPDVKLILVGKKDILEKELDAAKKGNTSLDRITIRHTSEEVAMDESPAKALRFKKDSSMRVAINLVKEGEAHACVSAGNTGALMATARFVLRTLPGIDRPAITTEFPTVVPNKTVRVLDLGADVDSGSEHLCQIAIMGSVLASVVDKIENPKVALLNIGSEEIKGKTEIKQAAQMLSDNKSVNYVGFAEGDGIFSGKFDVIVCDGFTGNVMLKSMEGVLKLVAFYLKRNIFRNLGTKLLGILAFPMLKRTQKDIDPDKYNGATFVGLRGVVIKSHGGANIGAFTSALEKAVIEARTQVPQKISEELVKVLQNTI